MLNSGKRVFHFICSVLEEHLSLLWVSSFHPSSRRRPPTMLYVDNTRVHACIQMGLCIRTELSMSSLDL